MRSTAGYNEKLTPPFLRYRLYACESVLGVSCLKHETLAVVAIAQGWYFIVTLAVSLADLVKLLGGVTFEEWAANAELWLDTAYVIAGLIAVVVLNIITIACLSNPLTYKGMILWFAIDFLFTVFCIVSEGTIATYGYDLVYTMFSGVGFFNLWFPMRRTLYERKRVLKQEMALFKADKERVELFKRSLNEFPLF